MTPTGWITILVSVLAGILIGFIFSKRSSKKNIGITDKRLLKVLNNPHLLVEKLKSNGEIYDIDDDGYKMKLGIKVGFDHNTGKEVVVIEEQKLTEEDKKKIEEDRTKKEKEKEEDGKKKKLKWNDHLAETRKQNPNLSLKEAMKKASKTYKK